MPARRPSAPPRRSTSSSATRSARSASKARRALPATLRTRRPTAAVPSTTSATWRACSPRVPSEPPGRGRWRADMAQHDIKVTVNGAEKSASVESRLLLVHLLREAFAMTGTHIGCDTTHCGACTVLLDGVPVKSCTVLAVQADGRDVMTVEGLEQDGKLDPIQEGYWQEHGLQCGYCTPGM